MQNFEPGPGLQSKLFGKLTADPLVDLQRVCVSLAAIQREHELGGKSLAGWMRWQQPLELADQPSVPSKLEIGIDPRLQRDKPELFQPADLAVGEILEGDVRQRSSAP